jgi:hypothetical protein
VFGLFKAAGGGFVRISVPQKCAALVVLLLCMATPKVSTFAQTENKKRPAVPVDPTTAVLDAFRSYSIVALSEGTHGNEQGHGFRLALVRDPRFARVVNDIVVEFGNAKYQEVIDDYVRGEDVDPVSLRNIWQNTTQTTTVWDHPIYEEFFRVVRETNAASPKQYQVRVLLGDPPIDWDKIQGPQDLDEWRNWNRQRDRFPAQLMQREVLAKGRRALLIYGWGHLTRRNGTIVSLLEAAGTKVFSVWTNLQDATDLKAIEPEVASWQPPSIAYLRGTGLGGQDYTAYWPVRLANRAPGPSTRMQDEFDALLYLGAPTSITSSPLAATLCDPTYMNVRLSRLGLTPLPEAVGKEQAEKIKTTAQAKIERSMTLRLPKERCISQP